MSPYRKKKKKKSVQKKWISNLALFCQEEFLVFHLHLSTQSLSTQPPFSLNHAKVPLNMTFCPSALYPRRSDNKLIAGKKNYTVTGWPAVFSKCMEISHTVLKQLCITTLISRPLLPTEMTEACITKGEKTSRKSYSFHHKISCSRSEHVLSGFRLKKMTQKNLQFSKSCQSFALHVKGERTSLMDFHYLGSSGGVPRCMERITRHRFPFLPLCCPTGEYARAEFFLLLQAKKCPQHLCLKLSTQPILRKAAVSNPKPQPMCKMLPVGFVNSIMFLFVEKYALVASAGISSLKIHSPFTHSEVINFSSATALIQPTFIFSEHLKFS